MESGCISCNPIGLQANGGASAGARAALEDLCRQTNPVFDLTISSFPGLGYRLERQSDLTNDFQPFGDIFTASGFTSTFQVTLNPGRDFVRAARK